MYLCMLSILNDPHHASQVYPTLIGNILLSYTDPFKGQHQKDSLRDFETVNILMKWTQASWNRSSKPVGLLQLVFVLENFVPNFRQPRHSLALIHDYVVMCHSNLHIHYIHSSIAYKKQIIFYSLRFLWILIK